MSAAAAAVAAPASPTSTPTSRLVDSLYSVVDSRWFLQRGVERELQGLLFDVTGEHGQARRLDLAVVREKEESFRHAPPSDAYCVTLWPSDAAGMPHPSASLTLYHTPCPVPRYSAVRPVGAAWCARPAGHA
jgi:hypothetical protein